MVHTACKKPFRNRPPRTSPNALKAPPPSSPSVELQAPLDALLHQQPHHLRAQYLCAKPLLLQQLQRPKCRPGVAQIPDVLGPGPVLQVSEVGDEIRGLEQFERGEVVEVEWGGEHADEFELELKSRVAAVEGLEWVWRKGKGRMGAG